jgi:hypothetical protein
MILKTSLIIVLFFFVFSVKAQLNGSYTIGTNGNYTSFAAAATALNSQGVSGNVIFNVSPGTYTEFFNLINYTGNSQYNVTFKSVGNDSTSVILQSPTATTSTNNFVVKFVQAKNITFSHMTVQRSGSNNYALVFEVENNSQNISFKSLIIKNNLTTVADDYATLISISNLNSSNTNGTTIQNCKLVNGSYGLFIQGLSSGTLSTNLTITDNIFENQYRTSIYTAYQNAPKILRNLISSQSNYSNYRAIEFLYCNTGPQISFNKINFIKGHGLFLANSQGLSAAGQIFNNFISVGGTGATAMYLSNAGTYNIYYNSINLYGTSAIGFSVTGSTSNHLRFANNILNSDNANKLMVVASSTIVPFDYCNFNNYRTSGMYGDWKATLNISNLTAWKTASSLDATSISVNPNFVSNTDLHIQNSAVQRAGSSMLNAPFPADDIQNTVRHNISPDMGAHERSLDDLAITKLTLVKNSCVGSQNSVKITIKNNSNYPLTFNNLQLKYSFNGNTISELKNLSNLAINDSIEYLFAAKISSNLESSHNLSSWLVFNSDDNSSNDTVSDSVYIYNYPVVVLPLDTEVCHNNTVTLDAGAGLDRYQWSTGDTTQTVNLSVAQLGLGGTFVSVRVWRSECSGKDSTLVIFKDCTGFSELLSKDLISVFPVPSNDLLNIQLSESIEIREISIIDLAGRIIYKQNRYTDQISIEKLSSGVYYLIVNTEKGIIRKSFIKH